MQHAVGYDEKWPVIIHSSLQNTDIFTLLNTTHKVRVSGSIIESSVIFPKSAVAFLILAIRDISSQKDRFALEEKNVERVSKFGQVHRNCFILTTSALIEENHLAILSTLQGRFFTFPLTYYPAHNHKECVSFMLHIAKNLDFSSIITPITNLSILNPEYEYERGTAYKQKTYEVTSKPTSTLLKTRLSNLASLSTSEEVVLNILSVIGISCHDCFVLHQGCHSLSNIAQASIQQLMDCSLDQETARKVYNFFHDN